MRRGEIQTSNAFLTSEEMRPPLCQGCIYRVLLKMPVVGQGCVVLSGCLAGVEGNQAVRSKGEDASFDFSAAVLL